MGLFASLFGGGGQSAPRLLRMSRRLDLLIEHLDIAPDPDPADAVPPDIATRWQGGDRIGAIRELRERTGLGLKESKEMLERRPDPLRRIERGIDRLLDAYGIEEADESTSVPAGVLELIAAEQKIEAIKVYRRATGAGLADAKAAVEELQRLHGP
jgi:ribosomal protein L7/L12